MGILEWVGLFVLGEVLLLLAAGCWQYLKVPIRKRKVWVVWLVWHVLPSWVIWRALVGLVIHRAAGAAMRAVDRHERDLATATYPPPPPGS